ncbi:MAG: lipopolysaccharide heptosyltransferase I [Flavobacteriales bacterium]|nr:lipopolysaccharide heptosyltransferase I [Flavobacteriales bacterium]
MNKHNIQKIAIVKLSAMGDIIHAMIALQFIKKEYPHLIIDWFVESAFREILENNPHINHIYTVNLKSIKNKKSEIFSQVTAIKEYAKNSYDLIIDAQGLVKSALVAKLLGKNIAGFSKNSIREQFASFFYKIKVDIAYDKNAIMRNAKVLSAPLGFEITQEEIDKKEPFLFFKNENLMIDEYLQNNKKNIVFVIGASWISKMYSKDKFIKIINALDENALIVWGNEFERTIATYIASHSKARVLPKLDLNDLKALICKMDLIIGNDTGPTHAAWALNIPSITIFGNTPGRRNTYETPINLIIESQSKVNPFKIDKNDLSINKIDEQKIIELAQGLLYETKN